MRCAVLHQQSFLPIIRASYCLRQVPGIKAGDSSGLLKCLTQAIGVFDIRAKFSIGGEQSKYCCS